MLKALRADLALIKERDPAARSTLEILLCYPGLHAISLHRLSHRLWQRCWPLTRLVARLLSQLGRWLTGIEIHPGARIGQGVFIDHGMGVVIGETAVVGNNCLLYQGVTLGALSFPRDENGNIIRGKKRHPTIEDHVVIYANATVLGGDTVVGAGSVIGASVSLMKSVPPKTMVTVEKPNLKFRER